MFFKKRTVLAEDSPKELSLLQEERSNLLNATDDYFMHEAFKTLRTNLNFALADTDDTSKVVAITSSFQGEGKSFTAINTAISYAQTDHKVLLIDCDLRRPKLNRLLGLNCTVGLSNVLLDLDQLEGAIQHTSVAGVDALLSGDVPPNPSELLGSAKMEKLLSWAKERYDYVILDTPPINMVTDTSVLAPKISGVIFVVRAEKAERPMVMAAVSQLQYAKAKILGFVLNGVPVEQSGYGYRKYGKYSRYYRQGYYRYEHDDAAKKGDL